MLENKQVEELFEKTFEDCDTYYQISDKLLKMKNDENIDALRYYFCNQVLYLVSMGYIKYDTKDWGKNKLLQALCKNIKLLPQNNYFYQAVYAYFNGEAELCLEFIEQLVEGDYVECKNTLNSPDEFMNESVFVDLFFEPFKQGSNGFWWKLAEILKKYPHQDGIPELCVIIAKYYSCKTDEEALDMLLEALVKYPESILIKELVAYTYYTMKLWNNAIAYFECLEETAIFFRFYDIYFMLAWCYGKIKNYREEEKYYRKTLEEFPHYTNALNNLGYCLYKQKRYLEAKTCFEECLEYDKDYIYASNNYVRVLIALGRNKEAKKIVKERKYKISKDICKRVEKLDNTNTRIKKDHTESVIDFVDDDLQENNIDFGIKRQQFSNEKILEDEITARIESGMEVFGLKLRMYKRKGVYGRQYIIPVGRLDLLCEDADGNLYVIELKKDSGYDDAYKQTAEYLDWFEKNNFAKGKKVFGIICLNSPTKELIEKVHADKRMKLYEYMISYKEI